MKYTDEGMLRLAPAILDTTARAYVIDCKIINQNKGKDPLKTYVVHSFYNKKELLIHIINDKEDIEKFYDSEWFRLLTLDKCEMGSKEITKEILRRLQ